METSKQKNQKNNISAIEKIRKIQRWCDWMNESFNDRFRKISDIEKVYDYCKRNDLEFCDGEYFRNNCEDDEIKLHQMAINKMLRYKLYGI